MYLAFLPFCLHPPLSHGSLSHATPQRLGLLPCGSPGFALASQARRNTGRIEFVILRTGSSLPVAPHLVSRRRNNSSLQAGERMPEEDFHLSNEVHFQAHKPPALAGGSWTSVQRKKRSILSNGLYRLRKNSGFVSGHDFSRAVNG